MLIPERLSDFFSLIPVTAKRSVSRAILCFRMGAKLCLKVKRWCRRPGQCYTWDVRALYFALSVTETIASRATSLEGLSPLHDKTRDLFLGRREGVQAYTVHVDKMGVIANTRQEVEIVLKQWRPATGGRHCPGTVENLFTENGLTLHKSEVSQQIKSLGVELDGLSLCCRVQK